MQIVAWYGSLHTSGRSNTKVKGTQRKVYVLQMPNVLASKGGSTVESAASSDQAPEEHIPTTF